MASLTVCALSMAYQLLSGVAQGCLPLKPYCTISNIIFPQVLDIRLSLVSESILVIPDGSKLLLNLWFQGRHYLPDLDRSCRWWTLLPPNYRPTESRKPKNMGLFHAQHASE